MTKIEQIRVNAATKAATTKQRTKQQRADAPSTPLKGTQAFAQEPLTVHSAESELDLAHSDFVRARDRLLDAAGFGAKRDWPQWVRTTMAYIAAFCTGYGIGFIFTVLMDMVAVSIASNVLFVLIYVIGLAIALALAYKLGGYIGLAIASGAAEEYVVHKYTATKNFIGAIFDRKDITLGGQHA